MPTLEQILRGDHVAVHFHSQEGDIHEGEVVSETKVLKSNAGYYIGHEYEDKDCGGAWFPYDRLSNYFKTYELAEACLPLFKVFKK